MIKLSIISEDLRKWFGKGPTGGWDRYNTKGEKVGKCGDSEEGSKYAACLSNEKAAKLGKDGRASFVKRKRAAQKDAGDAEKGGEKSKGQKPTFVKTGVSEDWSQKYKNSIDCNNPKGFSQKAHCAGKKKNESMNLEEKLNLFLEKNVPTDPAKWAASIAAAKRKFDVYPSAYANGWASKNYKEKGGKWKVANEGEPNALDEACWTGYKQVGMKKKGDREVPNCVPESVMSEASIGKLQKDYATVLELIQKHLGYYKSSKSDAEKKQHVEHLKKLNITKKKIEADMEKSISGLYKDAELKVED